VEEHYYNMEQLIKNNNISRRELSKFKNIVQNYQPNNGSLISLLTQYTYRYIDPKTQAMFDKTIDALFKSLDYPVEELEITDSKMLNNYKFIKDCIIEYCTTDIKDISTIIDNVAFLNNTSIIVVEKGMKSYMSGYGDVKKIMNAYIMYGDNYKINVMSSNLPETYIPIYSKAVVSKIKEMKNNTKLV